MDTTTMLWAMLISTIGVGYFLYGKKQGRVAALAAGGALFCFPYFVTNILLMIAIGAGLMSVPYFVKS